MAGPSETNWVVGELLRRDGLRMALETPTSIFKLPDSVTKENPQAYSPSRLFLGPFHELSPELDKMEIFKLEQAKKAKEKFQLPELTQMVDQLKELEVQIRASYDRDLAIGSEALALRILIDGLFLLRLLQIYVDEKNDEGSSITKRIDAISDRPHNRRGMLKLPIFDQQELYPKLKGNMATMTHNEMLKDLLKLENQIPIQVLKRVLPKSFVENLPILFHKFCASVSPLSVPSAHKFIASNDSKFSEILDQSQHLLHFLYALLYYQRFLAYSQVGLAYKECSDTRPVSLFVELPIIMAGAVQVGVLQQLVEAIDLIQSLVGMLGKIHQSSLFATETSPRFPSASELRKVGMNFHGGDKFGFDNRSVTLTLPIITVNAFSEVILRNLVAFEVEAKLNPASLSHYVKLMSGLIATAKDVGILKRAGIIACGRSGDEDDVVKLFNDLGNALNKVNSDSENDLNIELSISKGIINYYESRWIVKAERFQKRYIFPVLQALLILLVIVLILIVATRTVCGWFSCPKIMGR